MHSRSLICGLLSSSTLLCATTLSAQTHKVEAPEKVTRAIGVYEWTGDLAKPDAARLIPVSLFINGQFQDAGVYLAQPVPFVLQTGDVYSIERAGESLGTLDIDFARDIVTHRSSTDDNPVGAWYGYGRFLTPAQEAKVESLHASKKPPVVVASIDADSPDDDRPKFIRRQPSTATTTPTTSTSSTKSTNPAPSPAPDDDPDRPTLRHRDPTDNTNSKKKPKDAGYVTAPNTSLNDDPNRPTLRRGVPAEDAPIPQLTGVPPNLHQTTAVSDAANRDTHPFAYSWATATERAEILGGIQNLARPRLLKYLADNKLTPAPPARPSTPILTPASSTHAHTTHSRKPSTPPPPALTLANEQITGYTLTYGGMPTFVYTVEVPLATGGPVYLTMIAQHLPSGELQVALSSVTDAQHLDTTPWLRPIDVVDPDWSHRGSFLMELRAQSSRQFALYRLVTAKAEQTFVTGIIE
jgi:hypothetical protein